MTVLTNVQILHDGFDIASDLNELGLEHGIEEVEDTAFGDSTRSAEGGLETTEVSYTGYYTAGTDAIEDVLFGDVGVSDVPITVAEGTGADGDICYFTRYLYSSFSPFNSIAVGDSHQIVGAGVGRKEPLLRGQFLHNATVTTTGTGTAVQVGAVASGEIAYAALHVTDSSGDGSQTLDVTVESDDASGFGSPTTQMTFSQFTTSVGSGWQTAAGAITDDWWRVSHTVGGTGSPSFTYVVVLGIK